jgi:hypothetical protein
MFRLVMIEVHAMDERARLEGHDGLSSATGRMRQQREEEVDAMRLDSLVNNGTVDILGVECVNTGRTQQTALAHELDAQVVVHNEGFKLNLEDAQEKRAKEHQR